MFAGEMGSLRLLVGWPLLGLAAFRKCPGCDCQLGWCTSSAVGAYSVEWDSVFWAGMVAGEMASSRTRQVDAFLHQRVVVRVGSVAPFAAAAPWAGTGGKLTFRKKLFKLEKKIGEFHEEYYRPSIERLVYHRSYYKILGKNNVAAIRQDAFQNSPGSIATRSDYAEKFSFAPDGQLQGEYFSNNRSLSMEGCCLDHFTTPLHHLINMQTPGVAYVPKDKDVQRVFHSHFSDMSTQNAATTTKHLNSMLDCLFQNGQIVRGGTMYDTADGCRRIVIDRAIDAPGHGKGVVDGLNATDKGYL
eukprot:scaffold22285_cov77-Attheya_sp.AAC.1